MQTRLQATNSFTSFPHLQRHWGGRVRDYQGQAHIGEAMILHGLHTCAIR